MEMNFASKGVAGAGLGLGIAGTALGLLNGGLGNVLGGNAHKQECPAPAPSAADAMIPALVSSMLVNGSSRTSCSCNEDHVVNRYEAAQASRIAELETRNKLLESNIYTDSKIADIYERLNTKIGVVEAAVNAQAVYNATNTATINCISGQVAQLMALTKIVIPAANICPAPTTTTAG
jgi:hypothetical protein